MRGYFDIYGVTFEISPTLRVLPMIHPLEMERSAATLEQCVRGYFDNGDYQFKIIIAVDPRSGSEFSFNRTDFNPKYYEL